MQITTALAGFKLSCLADGYSVETLRPYISTVQIMARYLDDPDVQAITPNDITRFYAHLHTDLDLSTASHHRYWKGIRCFFKWAAAEFQIPRPDAAVHCPTVESDEIDPFSEEEVQRLLAGVDTAAVPANGRHKAYTFRRPNALRDRAIILVFLDTGVRVGELTRLKVDNLDLADGSLKVEKHHVKKTKSRIVHLSPTTRKAIWRYFNIRQTHPDDPVFTHIDGIHALSILRVERMIAELGEKMEVKDAHPHRFRHTFAIEFLRNGGDVFSLQYLLGHRSLTMVRRYLNLAQADHEAAHHRASPVERWRL